MRGNAVIPTQNALKPTTQICKHNAYPSLRETSKTRKVRLFEAKCTMTYTSKKNASLTQYSDVYIRF